MNIFLIFVGIVIVVVLLIFGPELFKNRPGITVLVVGVLIVLAIPVVLIIKQVSTDPVVGEMQVIGKDHISAHRSGTGRTRSYTPECHQLILDPMVANPDPDEPSDWIRSACVPNSQWLKVSVGDMVEMGYDKKRHNRWGSYIVGEDELLQSKNGKFRTHCALNEAQDDLICDEVSEAEYNKRFSEETTKLMNDKDFQKRLEEERLQRNQ